MHPRVYYDTHVLTNFQAWGAAPTNLEKARVSTVSANHLADRIFDYLSAKRPYGLHGSPTPGAYRYLLTSVEPDFRTVWQAGEGRLQLHLREFAPALAGSDSAPTATEPLVAVTLDSGEHAVLRVAVGKTVKLWERVLDENGM